MLPLELPQSATVPTYSFTSNITSGCLQTLNLASRKSSELMSCVHNTFQSLQLTNTGTPIIAKLIATVALAAMATRQVDALSMSAA